MISGFHPDFDPVDVSLPKEVGAYSLDGSGHQTISRQFPSKPVSDLRHLIVGIDSFHRHRTAQHSAPDPQMGLPSGGKGGPAPSDISLNLPELPSQSGSREARVPDGGMICFHQPVQSLCMKGVEKVEAKVFPCL